MFSSTVLDLAVGLVFCFLTVSLATGTVVEAISSIIKWRANTLRKGIGDILNDTNFTGLARQLYDHGAINPRGPGAAVPQPNAPQQNAPPAGLMAKIAEVVKQKPAYIDRQLFANALMDLTGISGQIAAVAQQVAQPGGARPTLESLHDAVAAKFKEIPNPQLQQLLDGIVDRSFGDVEKIRTELSTWFDLAMDRVGGAYKRWTQLVSFIVALILAAALNIDAVAVAKALWVQPKLAEQLKFSTAPPATGTSAPGSSATAAPAPTAAAKPPTAGADAPATTDGKAEANPNAAALLEQLNTTLPVGWPNGLGYEGYKGKDGRAFRLSAGEFGIAFVGWLIVALSTLFGAPFWFDLLQTVIRLKGSGPSPKEKVDGGAAAA